MEQRRERVDVVALERVDVAGEERGVCLVDRAATVVAAVTSLASSVARARCSALLTDATLVSSSSATSVAFQRSTSRRISTARCRGGRCCSAATNARRIVSRATATLGRIVASGTTRPSGIGWIQVTSGSVFRLAR